MGGGGQQAQPGDLYDETIFENPEIVAGERVLLHAERPHVEKRNVRGRLAIVTRHAVSVRKTIEVDLVHEELHVEYQLGDGTEMLGTQPETFSILLHAEEIEVVKRVRVSEEVVISKRPVTEQQRAEVTLRHEVLDVLSDTSESAIRSR